MAKRDDFDGDIELKFFAALHKRVGLCGHCGKKRCPQKSSWSNLPETIRTEDVVAAFEEANT